MTEEQEENNNNNINNTRMSNNQPRCNKRETTVAIIDAATVTTTTMVDDVSNRLGWLSWGGRGKRESKPRKTQLGTFQKLIFELLMKHVFSQILAEDCPVIKKNKVKNNFYMFLNKNS